MEREKRNYNRGSGGAAPGRSGDGGGNRGSRGGNYPHQQYGVGGGRRGWGPSSQQGQNQGQGRGAGGGGGGGRGGTSAWCWCWCWWKWWSPDVQSLAISEKKPSLSLLESSEKGIVPIRRPDKEGTLGGSNVELNRQLPGFEGDDHVMFWGADVNHPKAFNAFAASSEFDFYLCSHYENLGTINSMELQPPPSVSSSSSGTSPSSSPLSVSSSSSTGTSPSSSSDASLNERFQNAMFFN